jgi:hypothetical protein
MCTAEGTETSSPLTGTFSAERRWTIIAPHRGQASSGRTRRRAVRGEAFLLRLFFIFTLGFTFILVERDHHAVRPQDHE